MLSAHRATLLALACAFGACGDDSNDTGPDAGTEADAGGPDAGQSSTLVTIADGQLEGSIDGQSRRFLGIPFAKPPVGELRWKAPVPNDPWSDVRPATEFGARCAQSQSIQGPASDNEDCLYLNVWTPASPPEEPLPVMVWFHGGGNENGATSDQAPLGVGGLFYDGRPLAEHGVVVVTASYRLGPFGFFHHPQLAQEGSPSGNQGLLDQRRALEWVQENIGAFGGDSTKVTIFGESAGSIDVCLHVAADDPALFQRAISESGGCTTRMPTTIDVEDGVSAFVLAMDCQGAADALACLRAKPVADLLTAPPIDGGPMEVLPGGPAYQGGAPRWSFGPVVDGTIVPDQPRTLFDQHMAADVSYILGSNTDEGTLFHIGATPVADENEYLAALGRRFGETLAAGIATVYPVEEFKTPDDALQRVTGDTGLVCGTHDTARRAAAAGLDVWMYNFALPIPIPALASLGATHGAEIAFVFGSVDGPEQATVGEPIRGYWTRLAATGDPNGDGAVPWPAFSATADARMNFNTVLTVVEDFRATQCEFWRGVYDQAFVDLPAAKRRPRP